MALTVMSSLRDNPHWLCGVSAAGAGVLLGLAFFSPYLFILAWFALVPLLWSLRTATLGQAYQYGLLCGVACYLVGAYWIVDFIRLFKGYSFTASFLLGIVFWLYSAHMIAFMALAYRWLQTRNRISDFLAFPVLVVLFYNLFPMLFSCQLGESQSRFPWAIQAVDLLGVSALDGIIALVNLLVFKCLFQRGSLLLTSLHRFSSGLAISVVIAWFVYGVWAVNHWQHRIDHWEKLELGLVQPNEAPDTGRARTFPGYSRTYPPEMEMTERLAQAGAELVLWPEARYKFYFDEFRVRQSFRQAADNANVAVLFQDMKKEKGVTSKDDLLFNGAMLLDADGQAYEPYYKMKRVAFGEYFPLISELPGLKPLMERFFGEFTEVIQIGTGPVAYQTPKFNLVPLICYEVMFSRFVAGAVPEDARGYILAVLSSNGWFGDTIQPYQHIHSGALRAVENRLPMVHVLNNGPSTVILPDGRFWYQGEYHVAGGFRVSMPYSKNSGGSWYSRHPHVFMWFTVMVAGLCVLLSLIVKNGDSYQGLNGQKKLRNG